jgi:hypothetical protein
MRIGERFGDEVPLRVELVCGFAVNACGELCDVPRANAEVAKALWLPTQLRAANEKVEC